MADVRYALYEATFEQLRAAIDSEDRARALHIRRRVADLPLLDRVVAQLAVEDVVEQRVKRGPEQLRSRTA